MMKSQPKDHQRLHVAMITEGTYPFQFGGVSTWCHLLLGDLRNVDFTLISLVGSPDAELQFPLPSNVIDFRPIYLWGVREAAENRSQLGLTELLDAKARTSGQAITYEFIPQFRSFLQELYADKANLGHLAESIHGMYKFFVTHDFDRTLRSKAAWQCFLAETQEFFPSAAAQYGYPGAAFSLADVGRAMQWLYHWFFPLAQPLPKADVAHLAMAGLCTLIATAMKLEYGTSFMLTEHGIYLRESYLAQAASPFGLFHKLFNLRFALRMTELSYKIADLISPCCDYNQRWELRNGAQPAQIRTIYYGVDASVFAPTNKPFADPAVVCWVGRIDPLKDLFTLLRAAAIVQRSRPDIRFRLYGSAPAGNESYYAKCLALRAELGLEETVIFAGFRSNTATAFNEGDIVVLSSVSEAFPFSLLEAMLCEKPVVATAVGGVPEQVEGCGYAVEPRNPQEIAQAILALMNNPELAASFGRAGREKALREYSVRQSGSAHEAAYRELLARRAIQPQLWSANELAVNGQVAPAVDGRVSEPIAIPVSVGFQALRHTAASATARPSDLLSVKMGRPELEAPKAGGNGHNGTVERAPVEGMALTKTNGNGASSNGNGASSNGHETAAPLSALSWRSKNPHGIASLVEEVTERDPLPIEGLEITALLESMGITDYVALQRYGAPDVFELGAEVLRQMRAKHPSSASIAVLKKLPAAPPTRWTETLSDYARGPLALVTALSIVFTISAYGVLGGWSTYRLLALSVGLTTAMLVTSGFTQAPSRRISTYLGLGNPSAAGRFFWLTMAVGAACVCLIALVLALASFWLKVPLSWFTSQIMLTYLMAFLGLSAIWLMSGGLSIVRKTEWLTLGLVTGLVVGVLADRIAAHFTAAHLAVGTVAGFAVVVALEVQALIRGFHNWTPDKTSDHGATKAPTTKKARRSPIKKTRFPSVSYLVNEATPYFLYSALYMVFILVPHVLGWLGVLGPGQPRMWAVTSMEVGLTLALVPIILVGGVAEHTMREFWRLAPGVQANTPGTDVSQFGNSLTKFYGRYWRLYMLALTALSLAVYGAVSLAFNSGLMTRWLALPDLTQMARFFVAGLCINWLIGSGLFNCMFCITLGRPGPAVWAVVLAIAVTVIVGAPLSFRLNYSFAVVAFICGAIAFALASRRARVRVLKASDFHYVSSL
jgi:polysaccharide biosynthesis protein PelF